VALGLSVWVSHQNPGGRYSPAFAANAAISYRTSADSLGQASTTAAKSGSIGPELGDSAMAGAMVGSESHFSGCICEVFSSCRAYCRSRWLSDVSRQLMAHQQLAGLSDN
jgi:hypothetical protein